MFNQWDFVNQGFNGATLYYRSYTSAGLLHIVSTFVYSSLGLANNRLEMGQTTGVSMFVTATPNPTAGLDATGYSAGLITAVSEQNTDFTANRIPAHTGPMNWGVTCMHSTPKIQAGSTCYAFQADSISFGNFYRLVKMTNGPSTSFGSSLGTSYLLLSTTASGYWADGDVHNMSLFWFSDPYFLKGTWLIAYLGSTPIFNIVHTGADAIVSTSQGQGIYASGGTNASAVTWRSTTLRRYQVVSVNGVSYPPS